MRATVAGDRNHDDSGAGTAAAPKDLYEPRIAAAIAALDFEALCAEFRSQNELIFVPRLLPAALVDEMVDEVARFRRDEVYRVHLPWMRKAGTIGQLQIAKKAPFLHALHRSPSLLDFTSRLVGRALSFKHERDSHAAALYVYRERGDHVGFHYDDCGCEAEASYTGTFGIVHRSQARVQFRRPGQEDLFVAMDPGSFVFFCGSKHEHRVTPLGKGDDRVVYSFAYVREGKRLAGFGRFRENLWDALLYFGPRAILQRNYR